MTTQAQESPYHFEIGRVTGLPTASHAARFAITHNSPLLGLRSPVAAKIGTQRSVPLLSNINANALAMPVDAVSNWGELTEALCMNYAETTTEECGKPLTRSSPLISWLLSLDRIPNTFGATEREWTNDIRKAFEFGSQKTVGKIRRSAEPMLQNVVADAVIEGALTTSAYMQVVAQIACQNVDGDEELALKKCESLISSGVPFIIESSGFGKVMNDISLREASRPSAPFVGKRKYWNLSLDAANYEAVPFESPRGSVERVTFTPETRVKIMEAYDAEPMGRKDSPELFGCPAHAHSGVANMYKHIASVAWENGIFTEIVSEACAVEAPGSIA